MLIENNSNIINYSRAGDIFHYRWAVKRSLKLLDFNTDLKYITIEGSKEPSLAGECVVDLAEYRQALDGTEKVEYFQLKHSTIRVSEPFTLSTLKDTIEGFAKRFSDLLDNTQALKNTKFTVITNRLISSNFKKNIKQIANGKGVSENFINTLQKYTNLRGDSLKRFCKSLGLCDSEGNYNEQKNDIYKELAKLLVSRDYHDREKLLVAKIWEKIEPGQSNIIKKEDMLEAFDVTDFDDFFPAPPLFDPINNYIPRDEQTSIVQSIKSASTHTIITANGGVGKSILSSYLHVEFDEPSVVIAYDCFGNGSYRRTSAKRHKAQYAITQVINSLAKDSLCDPIIPNRIEPDEYWIKAFLGRIKEVCSILKRQDDDALLIIIFDAADNAEMAAEEQGSTCFVSQLLMESVPESCRLVFTCRPERLSLLDPPFSIKPIQLSPFSDEETLVNLRTNYMKVTKDQAIEFNRLTGGNPRVQSNALSLNEDSIGKLLFLLGGNVQTVEDLIEKQLNKTINQIKDDFPKNYRESIDKICVGLAVLPPFVPIEVLASVANVTVSSVKSFIADFGRPLWQIDDTVQFRDEPTEKWFQDNFSATPQEIFFYVTAIKPLAKEYPYVSEVLPFLLLKAEQLGELVELALSDDYLPSVSVFDDKKVKVQRLQYAFKAALKAQKLFEAEKLALIAGEEIAGNDRQLEIIHNNIDLTPLFLSSQRIQELAHKRELSGGWDGSEAIFSASLLSNLPNMKGEALNYLRSASYWLHRYFEKRDKKKSDESHSIDEKLQDIEIVELAFANYRINGWKACVKYLLSWTPSSCIYDVTSLLVEKLIDSGDFENIDLMADYGKDDPSFIIAITSELMKIGRSPSKVCITRCLNKIIKPDNRLDKPQNFYSNSGYTLDAYLSFFEACLIHSLPFKNIRRGINYYFNFPNLHSFIDDYQYGSVRENFLRYLSIQAAIKQDFDYKHYISHNWDGDNDSYQREQDINRAKGLIEKLLPWYMVRVKILSGINLDLKEEHLLAESSSSNANYNSYREHDPIPTEITKVRFQNILFCNSGYSGELVFFIQEYEEKTLKSLFNDEFYFLRASCRNDKLLKLSELIEDQCVSLLMDFDYDESPESRSEQYIKLARAVFYISEDNARQYLDEALNKASDFGDEGVIRWEAISSIVSRSSEDRVDNPELAHRYMRCAEMIGDSVSREKYWDRNSAVSTCFQLSPESTFSILSRWKDRRVGWHDRQIYALANNAIDMNYASPASLWFLAAFSWDYGKCDFLKKCLDKEPLKFNQQLMLDDYTHSLKISGHTGDEWREIYRFAQQYNLESMSNEEVERLAKLEVLKGSRYITPELKENESSIWDEKYGQFDILTNTGFHDAFRYFENKGYPRKIEIFWKNCYNKITFRNFSKFINVVTSSDQLDFYDLSSAFKNVPNSWKSKFSIQKPWNNAIRYIATRFPQRFTSIYQREVIKEDFIINEETDVLIKEGVISGLSDSVDIESANALFSFVQFRANDLSIDEAKELSDFSLSRLETYIENDYADGNWYEIKYKTQSPSQTIASYIFANLGSPDSAERWRAVHAVISLYTLDCKFEIGSLLECCEKGLPSHYVPKKYNFYNLHAKLYLLVALTRCANTNPSLLLESKNVFSRIALDKNLGILTNYYAKKICLLLQACDSTCFSSLIFEEIRQVACSRCPAINENKYKYRRDSPWHAQDKLGQLNDIWFAYDFDRYWFSPLGRVFGVTGEQVEDIAKYILQYEWDMKFESKRISDLRDNQWKNPNNWQNIRSSHFSYPKIDNYTFYISYHLLLSVASKLLEIMPVIEYDGENLWDEWLNSYLILNKEDVLLSELRDPILLDRRDWLREPPEDYWLWQVVETDFIDQLIVDDKTAAWFNVEGSWNNYRDGKNEDISFSTVLVPKTLSQSLLYTITDCNGQVPQDTFL